MTGRVQGVGFRVFVRNQAQVLDLKGWVRNRRDGAVEGEVCGTEAALGRLQALLGQGPPGARVDRLDWQAQATGPAGDGFAILR